MVLKYKIVSDSMAPLIPVGAEILIEAVKPEEIKRFDILLFEESPKLMCHYVWHVNKIFNKGEITTRNLSLGELDIPFEFCKVKGRVVNFKLDFFTKCKIFIGWV